MSEQSATAPPGIIPSPPARLEPDAIGVAQDTIIGIATSAPAAVVALTLASLAAATNYGSGAALVITAIPMLIIANAYRRLNMWNANCGASFEWVGRSINPYLGWLTGWLMIAAYVLGTFTGVEVLGPSVLAIFGKTPTSSWDNVGISTGLSLLMLVIAVIGIRITARTQVGMAAVEYTILIGVSIWGLAFVLGHHHGTFPVTRDWLSPTGIGGKGSAVAGFLIAVYNFSGWDATVYVNEEVKHRRRNPGRAAIIAVVFLTFIYTLAQVGLQGIVSPAKLQANYSTALVYVTQVLGGGGWAKVMALALALSVIGTVGTGIVVGARIIYGMASYRTLPEVLSGVSRRFSTPVAASVLFGFLLIALGWVYLLATSVQNAFNDTVNVTGLLFGIFYVLTALANMVYYRRRIFASSKDALALGLLPLGAAIFLGWMTVKSTLNAPNTQRWSLVGIIVVGLVLMVAARVFLNSPFFQMRRESDPGLAD